MHGNEVSGMISLMGVLGTALVCGLLIGFFIKFVLKYFRQPQEKVCHKCSDNENPKIINRQQENIPQQESPKEIDNYHV